MAPGSRGGIRTTATVGKLRVHIDQDLCVGSGECVCAAPEVFDQREEDGIVMLLIEEPDDCLRDAVKKAERLCPALAIAVEET